MSAYLWIAWSYTDGFYLLVSDPQLHFNDGERADVEQANLLLWRN